MCRSWVFGLIFCLPICEPAPLKGATQPPAAMNQWKLRDWDRAKVYLMAGSRPPRPLDPRLLKYMGSNEMAMSILYGGLNRIPWKTMGKLWEIIEGILAIFCHFCGKDCEQSSRKTSREARQNAFRVWIDDAMNASLGALKGAADFGSQNAWFALNRRRNSMSPWGAAMTYMFIAGEDDAKNAGMTRERTNAMKRALRGVLCWCICREVGFASKKNYVDKLKEVFNADEQHGADGHLKDIMAQMSHAFHRVASLLEIDNAFASNFWTKFSWWGTPIDQKP